jgi:hypothetical protein
MIEKIKPLTPPGTSLTTTVSPDSQHRKVPDKQKPTTKVKKDTLEESTKPEKGLFDEFV